MNRLPDGERVQMNPEMVRLTRINLERATEAAAQVGQFGFVSMYFRGQDGSTGWSLPGECDEDNRAMLSKVYELSHADFDAIVVTEDGAPDDERYTRHTRIPTSHGFVFAEEYVRITSPAIAGTWEEFTVKFGDPGMAELSAK